MSDELFSERLRESVYALAVMKYADKIEEYDKRLAYMYYDRAAKLLGLPPRLLSSAEEYYGGMELMEKRE